MSRFARMLVLFLVAAWLPVTLHCRLEAAGFYEADDCCATEQSADVAGDCKDDACPTVEEALYKEAAQGLKVATPALLECIACLASISPPASFAEPALSPERHAPPLELKVGWQFVTRAAPPARAPALNV
ncbi:MAG: hypothetical protein QG602_634 [Verrucomicrobiota bacterium]|nr:hypothetical protein [Verrucomicrobiota bacterium]